MGTIKELYIDFVKLQRMKRFVTDQEDTNIFIKTGDPDRVSIYKKHTISNDYDS